MVAVPQDPMSPTSELRITSPESRSRTMVQIWSPRAQPKRRDTWVEEIDEAMRKSIPKVPREFLSGPPSMSEIRTTYPDATDEERATEYARALAEYQVWNTQYWDMIEPTLDFSGAYFEVDRIAKRRFMVDDLRDGFELRRYVLDLAKPDDVADQIDAVDALSKYPMLGSGADVTIVRVDHHLNELLRCWLAVAGNSPETNYIDFVTRVMKSLPHEPVTSKVVMVRMQLAKKLERNDADTRSPDLLLKVARKYAKTLAMPPGDIGSQLLAPMIDAKGSAIPGKGTPVDDGAPRKGRPRYNKNDCDHCPLDLCLSNQWAKQKQETNTKKFCLVASGADPQNIPHYDKSGPNAPTSSEVGAMRVYQAAYKIDPSVNLKTSTIKVLKGLKGGSSADGSKGDKGMRSQTRQQSTPLMSIAELMGEAADQVSDPSQFADWANVVTWLDRDECSFPEVFQGAPIEGRQP